jgi:dethiobiotin synthetase
MRIEPNKKDLNFSAFESQIVPKEKSIRSVKKEEHSLNDFGSVHSDHQDMESSMRIEPNKKDLNFSAFESHLSPSAGQSSRVEPNKKDLNFSAFESQIVPKEKSIRSVKKEEHSLNDFGSVHSDHQDMESPMRIEPNKKDLNFSAFESQIVPKEKSIRSVKKEEHSLNDFGSVHSDHQDMESSMRIEPNKKNLNFSAFESHLSPSAGQSSRVEPNKKDLNFSAFESQIVPKEKSIRSVKKEEHSLNDFGSVHSDHQDMESSMRIEPNKKDLNFSAFESQIVPKEKSIRSVKKEEHSLNDFGSVHSDHQDMESSMRIEPNKKDLNFSAFESQIVPKEKSIRSVKKEEHSLNDFGSVHSDHQDMESSMRIEPNKKDLNFSAFESQIVPKEKSIRSVKKEEHSLNDFGSVHSDHQDMESSMRIEPNKKDLNFSAFESQIVPKEKSIRSVKKEEHSLNDFGSVHSDHQDMESSMRIEPNKKDLNFSAFESQIVPKEKSIRSVKKEEHSLNDFGSVHSDHQDMESSMRIEPNKKDLNFSAFESHLSPSAGQSSRVEANKKDLNFSAFESQIVPKEKSIRSVKKEEHSLNDFGSVHSDHQDMESSMRIEPNKKDLNFSAFESHLSPSAGQSSRVEPNKKDLNFSAFESQIVPKEKSIRSVKKEEHSLNDFGSVHSDHQDMESSMRIEPNKKDLNFSAFESQIVPKEKSIRSVKKEEHSLNDFGSVHSDHQDMESSMRIEPNKKDLNFSAFESHLSPSAGQSSRVEPNKKDLNFSAFESHLSPSAGQSSRVEPNKKDLNFSAFESQIVPKEKSIRSVKKEEHSLNDFGSVHSDHQDMESSMRIEPNKKYLNFSAFESHLSPSAGQSSRVEPNKKDLNFSAFESQIVPKEKSIRSVKKEEHSLNDFGSVHSDHQDMESSMRIEPNKKDLNFSAFESQIVPKEKSIRSVKKEEHSLNDFGSVHSDHQDMESSMRIEPNKKDLNFSAFESQIVPKEKSIRSVKKEEHSLNDFGSVHSDHQDMESSMRIEPNKKDLNFSAFESHLSPSAGQSSRVEPNKKDLNFSAFESQIVPKEKSIRSVKKEEHSLNDFGSVHSDHQDMESSMRIEPNKKDLNFSAFESQIVPKEKSIRSVKKEEHSLNDFGSVHSDHQDMESSMRIEPNKKDLNFSAFESQIVPKEKSIRSVKKEEHSLNDFGSVHSDHQDMESSMRIEPNKKDLNFSAFESHLSPSAGQSSRVEPNKKDLNFSAFESQIVPKEKSIRSVKKEEHSLNDFGSVHSDHQDMESSMRIEPNKKYLNFSAFESHLSPSAGQSSRVEPNKKDLNFSAFESQIVPKEKSIRSVKKEEHSLNDFGSVHTEQ